MPSVLEAFHPSVRTWFERRFQTPSRVQELGWPVIGTGRDVLLCAPTGSGKTLAAFLWAINRLVEDAEHGRLRDEVSVLYVSPLKALANDIRLNLDEPLQGIAATSRELGVDLPEIRAGLRTGDTPMHERGSMLRRPPHILVTTPESLFILLTSPRFREKLAAVRYLIVDELHAVAGNKRGAHLTVTIERLERLVANSGGGRPVRVGLSATLNPIERLARFLSGAEIGETGERIERPCEIVRSGEGVRQLDLQVTAPGPELGPIATHQHWEAMYDRLGQLIAEHRTTLIFTLSRRWAERVALNLQKKLGKDAVLAHHGSLARSERLNAEQKLKRGELKAIVATASLELGIDVGAVDLVCQIDSPKSISSAIQRIGRSGHGLGLTPKGRLFALTLDDLIECAAAVRAIRSGKLDSVEIPSGCLDVAAQQIVAIAAEESEIGENELLAIFRRTENFGSLDLTSLQRLLTELTTELPQRIQGATPKLFYDRIRGRISPRRSARLTAITSGGTIPEAGNYDVVIESQGRKIGDVEEDFAQESSRGDIFSLGSMPWEIRRISRGRLLVEPAPGMAPTLPFWITEAAGRSNALSTEIAEIRHEIAARLENGAAAEWLAAECALDPSSAVQAVDYVRRGICALGAIPDSKTVVAERFFDGLGGTQIVIHSPFGIRLNRALGLAIRKRLCQSFNFEIQASAIDDGVLLALNSRHSFPLEQVFSFVNSRTVRDVLMQALLDAPMFEVRFRHVATRALSVLRNSKGNRIPAWIQRLRSQDLMIALFPQQQACFENRPAKVELPDHFIVNETFRECLEESGDLPQLVELLQGIESGDVRTVTVDSIAPSVFAQRLLLAWDYSFLDDGERANRRSRTVQMNRGMAEDVFRKEDLSELLATSAVEQVSSEVSGVAPARRARDANELLEMLKAHGAMRLSDVAERVTGDSEILIRELLEAGRVVKVRTSPDSATVLVSAVDVPLFRAAYLHLVSADGIPFDFVGEAISQDSALEELVRRVLATSGPLTAAEIAARLEISATVVTRHLLALEAAGTIFRGHFTSASTEQWCDRYVLERIHRMTLAKLRAEVEPCSDREFADFRLSWSGVGTGSGSDIEDLAAATARLHGLAFSPDFWERAILPARIPDYRPESLDLLCLGGRLRWVGAGLETLTDFPENVMLLERSIASQLSQPSVDFEQLTEREKSICEILRNGGALYLDELADRAGISERDALKSLWRLASGGVVTNDSFVPLRLISSDNTAQQAVRGDPDARVTRRNAAIRAKARSGLAGRWSAVSPADAKTRIDAESFATLLLDRNGILSREMLSGELIPIKWAELVFTLRRMEYAGKIRRGYFVKSLSGEQYALPEALDALSDARKRSPSRAAPVALSAADPANPYGSLLESIGIAREPGNTIVLRAGEVHLGLAGTSLIAPNELDSDVFSAAISALVKFKKRLTISSVDGAPALESDRVGELAALRFHSDGRNLVYDGLPGPAPARVARN